MAIAELHDWLRGKGSYSRGIELLKRFGKPSATQLFLLERPENPFGRRTLTDALKAIHEKGMAIAADQARAITENPVISTLEEVAEARANADDPIKDVPVEVLPVELHPLRRRLSQMHTTKTFLRGGLRNTPDGYGLRKLCLEIIELQKELKAGWFIIETWRATGTILAEGTAKQVQNDGQLVRELNNLRSNITKYEKGQRRPNEEKLKAMRTRRDEIIALLDGAVQQ